MNGAGTSVVLALAAVLWLVYLVPTWFRRRQYLATELNAVRLQQTLRILAETAELPEPVRAETTARSVSAQQKQLRQELELQQSIEREREAAMSRAAARTLASLKPEVAAGVITHSRAARRLRRSRAATSAVLLLSLVAIGIGVAGLLPAGGALLSAAPAVLIAGGMGTAGCLALLHRMAAVAASRSRLAHHYAARAETPRSVSQFEMFEAEADAETTGWMPHPLPKPLYLGRPAPQPVVSEAALAEARNRILTAAAEAERRQQAAERAAIEAEQAEKVTPMRRPAAAVNRYAQMGLVDGLETGRAAGSGAELDDTLRRRRAV